MTLCYLNIDWISGKSISTTLDKDRGYIIQEKPLKTLSSVYVTVLPAFVWRITDRSHMKKNGTSKYCTFLRRDEKEYYNQRARNSLHCDLWREKKVAEILSSPVGGCISSGNLNRGQTSLCLCFEYQTLRGGRWDWGDRQTDRRKWRQGWSEQQLPTSL